jgi:hypothetical protein
MIVTPSPERAVRRTLRSRAVMAAAAAAIAVLTTLAPVSATAATTPTPPSPSPTTPVAVTQFTLSPIGRGVVRRGEPLLVSVTLQNGMVAVTAPATATLRLGSAALADRAALTSWLNGKATSMRTTAVGTATFDSVLPGAEVSRTIAVPAGDVALKSLKPGVYPLVATYQGPDGPVSSRSVMTIPVATATPTAIGVVVPITAGPLSEGLLTEEELTTLTAPDGSLTAQLSGVEGTNAILAIDPAIPASIRVLGTSAPETAVAWLDRLLALPQSRFALQFGDADVAAQLKSGLPRPLEPTSLQAYMKPRDFIPKEPTPAPTPEPTPTPSADPNAPAYPTLADLLDIGGGRAGVYWPAGGAAGPDTVAKLGALTIDQQKAVTLVPSATTAQGAGDAAVPARGLVGKADVLVYDSDASRSLQEASTMDDLQLRGAPLSAATAYLSFATASAGGAPLLVTLDRDAARSATALHSAIVTASEAPGAEPARLEGLLSAQPQTVKLAAAASAPARVAAVSGFVADESELGRFATVLDDPTLLTGPERAEILQLLGVAWVPAPQPWTAAVTAHRAATRKTLASVDLLPTSTINLLGSGANLGFWVRNDLPYPVHLVLYTNPDSLRLDVQRATPVTAGAASNTRVEVPVQARVGNGEVTLALQLRSPAAVPIGSGASVSVNVRAEWESFGIVALVVVVGALLVLGVARTVLRVRARRRRRNAATTTGVES